MPRQYFQSALAETFKFANKGEIWEGIIQELGLKPIKEKLIPYCVLLNVDGSLVEALMSAYALERIYHAKNLEPGGYLIIRYDGESKTIESAGNFAKLFSTIYYAPSSYTLTRDGVIKGTPTPLLLGEEEKDLSELNIRRLNAYTEIPFEDDVDSIDFESPAPEPVPDAPQKTKSKK